ncbi:MAG: hypothetical protein ACRYGC_09555 [Janthinobacterium lividum]
MSLDDAGSPIIAAEGKHNGARMAFPSCNLSVLAYANGFTLWHYSAGLEYRAIVLDEMFFESARDLVSTGDIVMVTGDGGGSIVFIKPAIESGA